MPYVSDLLTAAAASVTGTPTPTRSWQWLRGSTLISGATSSTYTVAEDDIGSTISVRQIETNIAGVDTATSTASFSTYTAVGPTDADNSTTATASGTDGILVWGADVRTASTSPALPAYQQITDAATYDTIGFPYYLEFVVDDYMQTAPFVSPLAQPNFIALAGLLPDSTGNSALYFDGLASGSRHFAYAGKNSTTFLVGTDAGNYSSTEPDGTSTNVWSFSFDGASSYLRQDGTQVATGNTGATTLGGLTLVGNVTPSASPHTTDIHGFILVNRTLTTEEITTVETYLAEKSGVTLE